MSDPVLSLVIAASFAIAVTAVRFFKTIENDLGRAARNPLIAGVASGCAIAFVVPPAARPVATGILLTLSALYVRLTGEESEPVDGMLLGGYTGAAAAVPAMILREPSAELLASAILAAAVAGFGITLGSLHVRDRGRMLLVDSITGVAAIAAAWLPNWLHGFGVADRHTLFAVASLVPLAGIASVFQQWSDVRAELSHEASLGFIAPGDVRATAHPLLRLGRGGWSDPAAHREFVRLANKIALRKRQQRDRPEDVARLYQLEIIKLRMQIQEMARIDRAISGHEDAGPSATMQAEGHEPRRTRHE